VSDSSSHSGSRQGQSGSGGRFAVNGAPRVEVRFGRGRLRVSPGDRGVVEVEVAGSSEGLLIEQHDRTVVIQEERPRAFLGRSYDVTLRVPADATLDCNLASADVLADGEVQELRARTASGDIRARAVPDRLIVKTASGGVEIGACGEAEVTTASGDVRVTRADGAVTLATASGDVRFAECRGDDLELRTVSGDVAIDHFEGRSLSARSVSGDLVVTLPPGRRVRYDLKTLSGRVDLPERAGESPPEPKRDVTLRAQTVSGDIIVRSRP
jgi:DUF4097 and DUF4098 domain-containing protein YvlB